MDPIAIINHFYPDDSPARRILLIHGRQVADKALSVARNLPVTGVDKGFIEAAALLHDIGMIRTHVPELGCHGEAPYIQHGVIGRSMLDAMGLHRYGLVCERHVGVGFSVEDIRNQQLPLPQRDMRPVTLEEEIICYADKFFSKKPDGDTAPEKTPKKIVRKLSLKGDGLAERFLEWDRRFNR